MLFYGGGHASRVALPRAISDERLAEIMAHDGRSREFLSENPIRNSGAGHGSEGFSLTVRLTSYRALPLSCVEAIELAIDGAPVSLDGAELVLGGVRHPLKAIADCTDVWWFILDEAELFVPKPGGLAPGDYEVSGTLVTVEPYITAGRFSFRNSATRTLTVAA